MKIHGSNQRKKLEIKRIQKLKFEQKLKEERNERRRVVFPLKLNESLNFEREKQGRNERVKELKRQLGGYEEKLQEYVHDVKDAEVQKEILKAGEEEEEVEITTSFF